MLQSSQLAGKMVRTAGAPAHTDSDPVHTAGWDPGPHSWHPPHTNGAPEGYGTSWETASHRVLLFTLWPLNTAQMAILFSLDKRSLSYTERELGEIPSRASQPGGFKIRPQRIFFFEDPQKGKHKFLRWHECRPTQGLVGAPLTCAGIEVGRR